MAGRLIDPLDRETYAALVSYVNSLPPGDELIRLLEMLGLLSAVGQRIPDALGEFLQELRDQTKAVATYYGQVDTRLSALPQEIASGVDPAAIAKAMSESFRQQLRQTGLLDAAQLLKVATDTINSLAADLIQVVESLRKMAYPSGGYASLEQSGPRPEVTAMVLNALRQVAATEDLNAHIALMERDLGDFEKSRPFILTTMLETSLLLKPRTKLVETLIDSLLAARRPYGDRLLWPEKAEPLLIDPDPSVAHTARAVRVLASVQAIRPASQVREALEQAVAWLLEQRDLHNAYEVTERPVNGGLEPVHVRHFTAAWVVKALVSAGVPAAHPSVSNAVAQIWHSYGGDTAALWAWDNGDLPIWMTFDAVEALKLANLAVPTRPSWTPS